MYLYLIDDLTGLPVRDASRSHVREINYEKELGRVCACGWILYIVAARGEQPSLRRRCQARSRRRS